MKLVSDAMLKSVRKVGERNLQTRFTHLVRSIEENDYGDSDEIWVDSGDVMGWIRQVNDPAITVQAGVAGATGIYRLHLPAAYHVEEGDMFIEWIESEEYAEPQTYMVQNVNTEDTIRVFTTCDVRKRK